MQTFTAFCQHTDGRGTMWIAAVEADDVEQAMVAAETNCAFDWDCTTDEIHVVGIAAGDVNILRWEDYC